MPFHTLLALPRNVLLDACVVMNASFFRGGPSRRAVSLLGDLGFTPVVERATHDEAVGVLRRKAEEKEWPVDPQEVVDRYLDGVSGLCRALCRLGGDHVPGISSHDQHVAKAAIEMGAWVLTTDTPLFVECSEAGLDARFPHDVIAERAYEQMGRPDVPTGIRGPELPTELIIRSYGLPPDRGSIFARLVPLHWAGLRDVGKFSACDTEGLGWLYYDSATEEWTFGLDDDRRISLAAPVRDRRPIVTLVNYTWPGRLELRVASADGAAYAELSGNPPDRIGTTFVGQSRRKDDHWNGYIQAHVSSGKAVSKRVWKALISTPNGSPHPEEEDAFDRLNIEFVPLYLPDSAHSIWLPDDHFASLPVLRRGGEYTAQLPDKEPDER